MTPEGAREPSHPVFRFGLPFTLLLPGASKSRPPPLPPDSASNLLRLSCDADNTLQRTLLAASVARSIFSTPRPPPCLVASLAIRATSALLKELQASNQEVKPVIEQSNLGEKLEKVSFIDNEPAFRWSLLQDGMAFTKLHEGIKKFAEDAEELKSLLKAKLQ